MNIDFSKAFEYENNFYLSCDLRRLSKTIIHYELLKTVKDVPGDIVECGVFKGASFVNIATFRNYLGAEDKKMIGFDIFGKYPETSYEDDKWHRESFIKQAGDMSIEKDELKDILDRKELKNFELIAGDINETVPNYNCGPISFLNLDTDIYEPAKTILEHLYPKISVGGILILDDYNIFPGETKAVDEYFEGQNVKIEKFSFRDSPYYIIKT